MTNPTPPVRPSPYIGPGDNWSLRVQVPGFGTWRRNPLQVSQTWTVYNQAGWEFHITISSGHLVNPAGTAPGTHITSNAPIDGRVLRWPDPGYLSPEQDAWMTLYNGAGEFNTLIAAFDTQLALRVANIQPSRDYDQALALYQQQRFTAAAARRNSQASFEADLAEWVHTYDADSYLDAFQDENAKTVWCVLDLNRAAVVRLTPPPLVVTDSKGLNKGFVNLCSSITGPEPLDAAKSGLLTAQLTMLRFQGAKRAMRTSEFVNCPLATGFLSEDQLVEQAVQEWTRAVEASEKYQEIVSDKTTMNITGPDGKRYHVTMSNLLKMADLKLFGSGTAATAAKALSCVPGLPGVYSTSCVPELQAQLPPVTCISRTSQVAAYIMQDMLLDGWSKELEAASSVNPQALADNLASKKATCQVFADNLLLGDQGGMTVYLLRSDGSACYVGPMGKVVPGVQAAKDLPVNLQGQASSLKGYLRNGLSVPLVLQDPDSAVVVCGGGGRPVAPLIFLDVRTLQPFDLAAARDGFVRKEQERLAKEKAEKEERLAKEKAAADKAESMRLAQLSQYSATWDLVHPNLVNSGNSKTLTYQATSDRITFVVTDEKHRRGWYRRISIKYGKAESEGWVIGMKNYILDAKSGRPPGYAGILVTIEKG